MASDRNRSASVDLSRSKCLRLLASCAVGRIPISRGALPEIVPVAYRLVGEDVVFVAGIGPESLAGVAHGKVIAFEVDHIDPVTRSGWSVVAVGMARQLDEAGLDAPAVEAPPSKPLAVPPAVDPLRMRTNRLWGHSANR